jgi:LAO/AO transport system kinase
MIELVDELLQGNRRALARLLTHVENEREGVETALAALFPHTGQARIIGVTGAPGTGKSTLVTELAKAYRRRGQTVGIIAVDPTSPFTGGAILGDRIRMRDLAGDAGVFIRSMATRGSLGGLARATRDSVRVLDAAGFNVVLVETVGAGQSEVDIVRMAQTTLVVDAPGLGDEVQAIKAGILEIADVLIVNKADHPGATNTVRALRTMLELGHPVQRTERHHGQMLQESNGAPSMNTMWIPPILQTIANQGKGVDEVLDAIDAHRRYLEESQTLAHLERQQIEVELHNRLRDALIARLLARVPADSLRQAIEHIQARTLDPQTAVQQLLDVGR